MENVTQIYLWRGKSKTFECNNFVMIFFFLHANFVVKNFWWVCYLVEFNQYQSENMSICSDSEEEERPRSAKTSVDLSASPWPINMVNFEDVSSRRVSNYERLKTGAFDKIFIKSKQNLKFSI